MSNFGFFSELDEEIFDLAGIKADAFSFSYKENNIQYPLNYEYENGEYILLDDRNVWDIKKNNLILKTRVIINNPTILFGKEGIAPSNSRIHIALQWMSKTSNNRGTKDVVSFSYQDNIVDKTIMMGIKPGSLKDSVKLRIVFVLGDVKSIEADESMLANKRGLIIGAFNEAKVMLEGKGSEFPIVRVANGSDKPLWVLEYNASDPETDKFTPDNVCLVLNTDHGSYKCLDEENLAQTSPLFKEVFSTTIALILNYLDRDGYLQKIKDDNYFEEGSVCAAMHYFVRTFNIDIKDLATIMSSVKESVDRYM